MLSWGLRCSFSKRCCLGLLGCWDAGEERFSLGVGKLLVRGINGKRWNLLVNAVGKRENMNKRGLPTWAQYFLMQQSNTFPTPLGRSTQVAQLVLSYPYNMSHWALRFSRNVPCSSSVNNNVWCQIYHVGSWTLIVWRTGSDVLWVALCSWGTLQMFLILFQITYLPHSWLILFMFKLINL